MYVDDAIIDGQSTLKRPFIFTIYFYSVQIIPKETFNLISAKLKDECGVETFENIYYLVCNSPNLTSLNSINFIFKIKSVYV